SYGSLFHHLLPLHASISIEYLLPRMQLPSMEPLSVHWGVTQLDFRPPQPIPVFFTGAYLSILLWFFIH
ncbi:hypothetical protein, partial [Enterobacter cloacae]|uniref:hypothetical protein n=1 Tax=Enterobacter cloacae TaxID=550 RepID=UPI0021D0D0F1